MSEASNRAFEILKSAYGAGRLHHAILLYGSSLSELEKVSQQLASTLLGRECKEHPDLFELRPEGKARMIKIGSESDRVGGDWPPNTMRWLLSRIRKSPNAGERKVAIIYEADTMNAATSNAFLKTLEEPPADTNIFMLSTRPNDLLDTIRSRCVSLRVDGEDSPISDEDWRTWIDDFIKWQKSIMRGISGAKAAGISIMNSYGLLARFDEILSRLGEEEIADVKKSPSKSPSKKEKKGKGKKSESSDNNSATEVDPEVLEAELAGRKRAIRKRMFAEIEKALASCALGGEGVPAVKLARAVSALEKASGLTELNMSASTALEYFMISSLRIWGR